MARKSHGDLVANQFGTKAQAYVTSTVHAQGEDLEQLEDLVRGHSGARVLDMGCGGGHVAFHVAPHTAEVIAFDLSTEMLQAVEEEAGKRGLATIRTIQGAVEDMPFADGEFDFVFSRYSAHHWRDLRPGLKEARRVLKPGGVAGFVDLVSPGSALLDTFLQAIELVRDPSHVRDYSVCEWEEALKETGFAPANRTVRHVHLDFVAWISRMQTPSLRANAIVSLVQAVPEEVVEYFQIEGNGDFTVDVATLIAADV
jgi:ubiquinone/menaquinone biosynthesis C-methylase UbiE